MSIFASQTQLTVAIPFDIPQAITIRKLTGLEIDAAAVAHRDGFVTGSARLWPTVLRRALVEGAKDPDVLKAIADPLTGYDRFALVKSGLLAWTYEPKAEKPDPAKINDLDDEAVDFIATAVLRLTKPALFQTAEEQETARKNASSGSIET